MSATTLGQSNKYNFQPGSSRFMKKKYMVQKLVIFTILNLMMWPGGALTLSIVLSNVSKKIYTCRREIGAIPPIKPCTK